MKPTLHEALAKEPAHAQTRGVPSLVWTRGLQRRFDMIRQWAGPRLRGRILDCGTGTGTFLPHLAAEGGPVIGLEAEWDFAKRAGQTGTSVVCGVGEHLPFPEAVFDLVLSHEVIEHVHDDRRVVQEMIRVLKPGGRLMLFCPHRGYPFETHGVVWRGRYRQGNIPLVNYLPRKVRDRLVPHVRVYGVSDLHRLFRGLPVKVVHRTIIFGGYDNIAARWPRLGQVLRRLLWALENTPLRWFGLSHFWVVERM